MALTTLRFPTNDDKLHQHYVNFFIGDQYRLKANANTGKLKALGGVTKNTARTVITLPLPADLATSYKSNYSTESLGAAGFAAAAGGEKLLSELKGTDVKEVEAARQQQQNQKGNNPAEATAAGKGLALSQFVQGTSLFGGGVQGAFAAGGIARNPHQAVLFDGVDLRSHSFSYKLVAKNQEESIALRDVIDQFKYYMSPSYTQDTAGHFFNYPNVFNIEYSDGLKLHNIGSSVLTSFDVNYHGEGTPLYFDDGSPFSVNLTMAFQELQIVTREDIRKRGM